MLHAQIVVLHIVHYVMIHSIKPLQLVNAKLVIIWLHPLKNVQLVSHLVQVVHQLQFVKAVYHNNMF